VNTSRERLLAACIDYVRGHGTTDFSLRQCAAAVGSSHRMLSYHFGSRQGLLAAIVLAVAAEQRARVSAGVAVDGASAAEVLRALWNRLAGPAGQAQERLFFELYAMTLQHRLADVTVLDGLLQEWTAPLTNRALASGLSRSAARAEARLSLAVLRGLLLELLATGNRRSANAALERYLSRLSY